MLDENLKYLRKKHNISQMDLADTLNISRTALGDYERGKTEPNLNMLIKLADYFHVKVDDMLRHNLDHLDHDLYTQSQFKVLAITIDSHNRQNIELVETKAEAGYLEEFQNPEFIKELPKISFPNIPMGTYRGFEIEGDSMLPLEPGTMLICEYVEKLSDIKDNKTYVVVGKNAGMVYKRVVKDENNHRLILHSDNAFYKPYTMDYIDVQEIWVYYAHLAFNDVKRSIDQSLDNKLSDLEKKLDAIHGALTSR